MRTAAAIDNSAAVTATGFFQERAMARSPSSADITRHSRSRGAVNDSADITASSCAVRLMAAWRA